ncbi:MAG: hypothetical protein ACIAS6_03150 [Phycisphaerales bacterium JB060]
MAHHPDGPPPVPDEGHKPGPPPVPKGRTPRRRAATHEIVADVAVGPNLRVKDNLFQAVFILASIALAAGVGAFMAPEEIGPGWGAAMGGIVGLIAGALLSGGILMVYRLFRH